MTPNPSLQALFSENDRRAHPYSLELKNVLKRIADGFDHSVTLFKRYFEARLEENEKRVRLAESEKQFYMRRVEEVEK